MRLPRLRLVLVALSVSLGGSFHFGYQLSVINPTQWIFEELLNETAKLHYGTSVSDTEFRIIWSVTAGLVQLGAVVGVLTMPFLSKYLPTEGLMLATSATFVLAGTLSALTGPFLFFEWFIIGRALFGICIGIYLGLQAIYLAEITPREHRGFVGAFTGLMVEAGIGTGGILGLPSVLGSDDYWPYLYWLTLFPSLQCICTLIFVTPPNDQRSEQLLTRSMDKNQIATYSSKKVPMSSWQEAERAERKDYSVVEILYRSDTRPGLALGCLVHFLFIFSGINAYSFFGTSNLETAGFEPNSAAYANAGVCCGTVVGALCSMPWIDRIGRRPIMICSVFVLSAINTMMVVLISVQSSYPPVRYVIVFISFVFMFTFGGGLAAIVWFIPLELVPQPSKAATQMICLSVDYLSGFTSSVIFFPLVGAIGQFSFLVFAIPLFFGGIYLTWRLPETKNREEKDILRDLGINGSS